MNTHLIVRRTAGSLFILAGTFKVLLWGWHRLQPGTPDFASALRQLGVPFAEAAALAVPIVEIVAGIFLLRGQWVRLSAAVLAIDMLVAIVLVGLPGWRGQPLQIGAQAIGQEPWRLPLELLLLLAVLWLVWKPRHE